MKYHLLNRIARLPGSALVTTVICCFVVVATGTGSVFAQEQARSTFDDNVKTILRQRCSSCHSPTKKSGDLDVTSYSSLMMGGSSGTVIEAGDADGSHLVSLIKHEEEPSMPPGGKIPDPEIELIAKWINEGAPENSGSKVQTKKKTMAAVADPQVRPETVAVWPRIQKEPIQVTSLSPAATSIATSPWAPLVAVGGQNQVLLYNADTLQLQGVLPFPEGSVNVLKFSRTGAVLLAAGGKSGSNGVAVLWDVASGERIGVFGDELDSVLAADISPDHQRIALGGPQRVVNVYSTSTGLLEYSLTKHTDWVTAIEFSVDGVLLASGDRNGGLYVFEAFTGREYLTLKGHEQTISDISWQSDSNVVASACKDTTVRLWEMNNGGQIRSWNGHGGGTTSVEFLRDGRVVSTGNDRVTRLWNADGTKVLDFPATDEIALSVAWCNESARCIAGDYLGNIRVWNGVDGAEMGRLTPNPPTLQQRIESATAQLNSHQIALAPILQELATATEAASQAAAIVATAQLELDSATIVRNELQGTLAAANEKLSQATTQSNEMQTSLETRTKARSLVDESLAKLREAVASLPGDEALLGQVNVLTQRMSDFETEITSLQTQVAVLQPVVVETSSQVTQVTQVLTVQQTSMEAMAAKVQQATDVLTPLAAKRDLLTAQAAPIQASLSTAQSELVQWNGEIAFIAALKDLEQQRIAAELIVAQQQEKLATANEALAAATAAAEASVAAARTVADAAQAEVSGAEQQVQQVETSIDTLRQRQ